MATLISGLLILGSDASDESVQVLGIASFAVGMATLLILTRRLDRRRDSGSKR
jgi:hypothetical protein